MVVAREKAMVLLILITLEEAVAEDILPQSQTKPLRLDKLMPSWLAPEVAAIKREERLLSLESLRPKGELALVLLLVLVAALAVAVAAKVAVVVETVAQMAEMVMPQKELTVVKDKARPQENLENPGILCTRAEAEAVELPLTKAGEMEELVVLEVVRLVGAEMAKIGDVQVPVLVLTPVEAVEAAEHPEIMMLVPVALAALVS